MWRSPDSAQPPNRTRSPGSPLTQRSATRPPRSGIDIIPAGVSPSSPYARSHRAATSTSNKIPLSKGTGSQAPAAISPSSCPGPQLL